MNRLYIGIALIIIGINQSLFAQDIERNINQRLNEYFNQFTPTAKTSSFKLNNVKIDYDKKEIAIYASENFSYQPLVPETVEQVYKEINKLLPGPVCYFHMAIYSNGKLIENLIPNFYLKKKDKSRLTHDNYEGDPWIKNTSKPFDVTRGLDNRHIALWQSHGKYFKNDSKKWEWQRPRLFCTNEDLFTQSFVIPYLIPMLENAGGIVYTPRERDTQKHETIVDNEATDQAVYLEMNSKKSKWGKSQSNGWGSQKNSYSDSDSPFSHGSARTIATEKKGKAFAEWVPTIPKTGKYAVYVTYQSFPNSVSDAKYLVFHKGGVTEFKVNQKMGSGTWTYLGTFEFDKGNNDYGMVVLNNGSKEKGVVSADAVRFGGGMGNIKRGNSVSGLPRYLEGARYTAQWNGMPAEIFSNSKRENDYADDINARANTVNYLSGGSVFNPKTEGLHIPFEMTLALHSDAGYSKEDGIIGSLGVYTTDCNNGLLNNGTNRLASRDLADLVLTQVQKDIQQTYKKTWTRRSMWDRNYSETRIPGVPSAIIELLSHQNFADMQLGHDPNYKFTVSRAIYKGILRFLSTQNDESYVVQPLPIRQFAIQFGKKKNTLNLSWKGQNDPIEPTATPKGYIVYTRVGYGGFDNGVYVSQSQHTVKIEPGLMYSFKITAINHGGESFPSEILAAYKAPKERSRVLIINGFNRLSGPAVVNTPTKAGFDLSKDPGVSYLYNMSYCGAQQVFDRALGGKEGERSLGYSSNELEGIKIAGNTFDYPFIHGKAIQASGQFSFVSCSNEAAEHNNVSLEDYPIVDFILGLQKEDQSATVYYKTFSSVMQRLLTSYCHSGGRLLVSGSYLGSDMNNTQGDRGFTQQLLKYSYQNSINNKMIEKITGLGRTISIPRELNENTYVVAAPESLLPVSPAFPVMTYSMTNESAGIAYKGTDYRTFILGFPFESIESDTDRSNIMATILKFFSEK